MNDDLGILGDVLRAARRFGERDAFADQNRVESFVSIERRVLTLVDALKKHGVKPGDRVAILSRNSVSSVECILTACAGFILVPLNWRLSPQALNSLVKDCAPRVFICDESHRALADEVILHNVDVDLKILLDCPSHCEWTAYEELMHTGQHTALRDEPDPDDLALIIYTSGTTGTPKGVSISHRALTFNMRKSGNLIVGAGQQDRSLMVMPMFHVGGLCFYLLAGYLHGTTTILRPAFQLDQVVQTLRDECITNIHLVPTMIADLTTHPAIGESVKTLRRIMYAGSTMPVALLNKAMATFSDCAFIQAYGSTEAGVISALGTSEHNLADLQDTMRHLLKSCGRPVSDVHVQVIKDDGTPCRAAELGEVTVQSPGIMQGYWGQPVLTENAIVDGYLRTGDIGYFDPTGYLYLVDRKSDMIVTGGENVFPAEVEQILYDCPDIAEAAVFGVLDPKWIEKIVVAVKLREGATLAEADIIAFTRQRLAGYKCPKEVLLMSELPRTGAGKVSRRSLRQLYSNRDPGAEN